MTTKFLSSAMAIVTLDVCLQSQLHPGDLLFLFASNSLAVNLAMLLLSGLALYISFKKNFSSWYSFIACAAAAASLGFVGMAGGLFSNLDYRFSGVLLPLDYLLILQAAIIFSICALSYEHAAAPAVVNQIKAALVDNTLDFLIPKIPHSPTLSNPAAASGHTPNFNLFRHA